MLLTHIGDVMDNLAHTIRVRCVQRESPETRLRWGGCLADKASNGGSQQRRMLTNKPRYIPQRTPRMYSLVLSLMIPLNSLLCFFFPPSPGMRLLVTLVDGMDYDTNDHKRHRSLSAREA